MNIERQKILNRIVHAFEIYNEGTEGNLNFKEMAEIALTHIENEEKHQHITKVIEVNFGGIKNESI